MWKLSQFTKPLHNFPNTDDVMLYNTLTRAMVKIDSTGWRILQHLQSLPTEEGVQQWLQALANAGFIVPENIDEGQRYIEELHRAKGDTSRLHVTLSLIQRCNFGCGYCYQGGTQTTHDNSRITDEGVDGAIKTDEILAFLRSESETRGVKQLFFTAYGGEPLLNKTALIRIVSQMQTYCRKHRIEWGFSMVSNGSLLNRKTVLELIEYGFMQVQITIDGNRETHNISRPWRNPKGALIGTYDLIMQNLVSWAGLIHTDVLCVVDESNISAAHELIDTLADKGLAEKRVRMKFSPISPTYDDNTIEQETRNFADNPALLETESQIIDAITQLQIHAAQRGLIADLRPTGTWCAVIRANGQNVTITPDGKIYSCALFIGRDEKYETGHISELVATRSCAESRGGLDRVMEKFSYPDECKRCEYLPICANCRADTLAKTGEILGANSQKEKYDRMLPKLIKAHHGLLQLRRTERR